MDGVFLIYYEGYGGRKFGLFNYHGDNYVISGRASDTIWMMSIGGRSENDPEIKKMSFKKKL